MAREAGVALGLVNYYYDKVGLIAAALRRIEEQGFALVVPDPSMAPQERLSDALRKVVEPEFLSTDYPSLRLQLWALANTDDTFATINAEARRAIAMGSPR